MLKLVSMTEAVFNDFKGNSQREYAKSLIQVEDVPLEEGLKNASEQFDRLVPNGLKTTDQFFFEALDEKSGKSIGYLWLGAQNRFGRKVVSINEIMIREDYRGKGLGKSLMECVEQEATKLGSNRIRLHVFHHNEIAKKLYTSMGFKVSSIDMFKII